MTERVRREQHGAAAQPGAGVRDQVADDPVPVVEVKVLHPADVAIRRREGVTEELLEIVDRTKKNVMYKEDVLIYDDNNKKIYDSNDSIHFDTKREVLNKVRSAGEQQWRIGKFEMIGVPYNYQDKHFVVTVCAIDRFGNNKMENLRTVLLVSFFFSLLIVAWSGWP